MASRPLPTLRATTAQDVEAVAQACQDPDIQRFTRAPTRTELSMLPGSSRRFGAARTRADRACGCGRRPGGLEPPTKDGGPDTMVGPAVDGCANVAERHSMSATASRSSVSSATVASSFSCVNSASSRP